MELKEGMYVRYIPTIGEYTQKISKITKTKNCLLDTCYTLDDKEEVFSSHFDDILGASHNIIDLIEVGDYLNGFKVSKIERYDTKTIIKIGNSTFNVLEGEEIYTPSYDNNNGYEKLEKLKSIVTKDQFESMSYEVE